MTLHTETNPMVTNPDEPILHDTRISPKAKDIKSIFSRRIPPPPSATASNDSRTSHRFSGIKRLLTGVNPGPNRESQIRASLPRRSKFSKKLRELQKIAYVLMDEPTSTSIGRIILGTLILSILTNLVEAIIISQYRIISVPALIYIDAYHTNSIHP